MSERFRTACPHCASVFRLGADQLAAAQGWVQCSVCGSAFDARPSLQPENPPAGAEPPPTPAVGAKPPPNPFAVAAEPDLPSIILIDPDLPAPEDFGPLPEIPPVQQPFVPVPPFVPVSPRAASPEPSARIEYATPLPPPPRRGRPWLAGLASLLLLAALLAQSAYFLRDTLVSRYPETRPALEQTCVVLGCSLSLPKNLALLQIIGSDLQTEAAGQLRLNLTLGNRASRAQAWPVLVLTLTDQRNRPLARRSFAPSEYLSDTRMIAAGMPPLSEQPLSLALAVRDLAPMGFNLQLSY